MNSLLRSSLRMLAAALAAVLVLSGLSAPAAAAPRDDLSLKATAKVRLGKQATLKVSWRKAGKKASGKVRLQAKRAGSWSNVRKVAVKNGKARIKVTPTSTTRYRLKKGSRTSKAVKVKVDKQWIAFKTPDKNIRAGDAARLNVSNFRRGVRVAGTLELQRKVKKGWKAVRTVTLDDSGRTTVLVKPKKNQTYRFVRGKFTSPERSVKVERDWVGLALAETKLADSASTTSATVRWYQGGKKANGTAVLQQRLPGGKWTKLQDVAVTKGTATLTIQPTTARRYRVKAGSLKSAVTRVTVDSVIPASFSIEGSGWGHGLGMSQYGANAMAKAGKSVSDILTNYYTDTAVEQLAFPTGNGAKQQLRVQVIGPSPYSGRASDNRTSVPVTVRSGGWALRNASGAVVDKSSSGDKITFKIESGEIKAYKAGTAAPIATAKRFRLLWDGTRYRKASSARQTNVHVGGAHGTYRHGRLDVRIINGQLNISNELLLNTEYLYGIAEMPSSWGESGGAAALQAQAIAARNYAASAFLTDAGNPKPVKSNCHCHVVDDVYDQHFTGWNKEGEGANARFGKIWKAAVDATVTDGGATGQVLRYTGSNASFRGKLVTAYYSSSSGGATMNSEDVWASYMPYIRSVDDPWSHDPASGNPYIKWTATMTQREAQSFFGLPDVVSVAIETYEGGGMRELTATSSSGQTKTRSGKADSMRTNLNASSTGYVRSSTVTAFKPVGVN